MEKRYQYYGPNREIKWTDWFPYRRPEQEKWQVKNKLLNEYKDE